MAGAMCRLSGMSPVILAALVAVSGPSLRPERQAAIVRTYHSLRDIEKHRIAALPTNARFERIDVSDRIRSASFGHSTTLLVPDGVTGHPTNPNRAREFYVEYGPSTNAPGGIFGPFKIER